MKSAILAVVVVAGVGGFASPSYAQDVKKLQPHPAAAADSSLQQGAVDLPSTTTGQYGGAGAAVAKPTDTRHNDDAVASGTSTDQSKQLK